MNLSNLLRISTSIYSHSITRTLYKVYTVPDENYRAPYNVENFEKPPIWADPKYKRKFKGHIAPKRTTRNCYIFHKGIPVRKKKRCPVCDNNQYFTYKDIEFIKNFICPIMNELLHCGITGVCRYQQQRLMKEFHTAQMHGYLLMKLPRPELDWLRDQNVPK
ncbi:hypothetical protein LOD99_11404 [Oopsacas minuta]|uniref:Small ribosomal subunit protein mS40 n=1 Tax=Oopsacas minuta TaxID=111878 RepID=A0AAV7K592_9METZ|nr:hypothetical protein LOD99_11404 [Oopsacas minuta]